MTLETEHTIIIEDAGKTNAIPAESIDLVVTSPPYPMIAMWDDLFCSRNTRIAQTLKMGKGWDAFELMHQDLTPIWDRIYQVLKPGGFACINIGDATRTLDGEFALYPNHSRILSAMLALGFTIFMGFIKNQPEYI